MYEFLKKIVTKYLLTPCVFCTLMKNNLVGYTVFLLVKTLTALLHDLGETNYILLNGKKKKKLMAKNCCQMNKK